MFFLDFMAPYWFVYAQFLTWSGLLIPLFLWKITWQTILAGGLGVVFAENFFYIWVSLFGNLNGCYNWYSGNPLNPDGNWGYSWTNPLGMQGYFERIISWYSVVALVQWSVKKFAPVFSPFKTGVWKFATIIKEAFLFFFD
jgi:hypothetical protein